MDERDHKHLPAVITSIFEKAGVFHWRTLPCAKLPGFFGNQRVIGVVGLPVGECLDVGPLFVVLRQVTYPQQGTKHQ